MTFRAFLHELYVGLVIVVYGITRVLFFKGGSS